MSKKTLPITALRVEMLQSFQALQSALATFIKLLNKDSALPVWLGEPPHDRKRAAAMFRQLEYVDGQDPKESVTLPGLIACSEPTIAAAETVNQAKDRFQAAVQQVKKHKMDRHDPELTKGFEKLLPKRPKDTSEALERAGLARLHLRQCYRKIPLLEVRPIKASFTWANTRAITKITKKQAKAALSKLHQSETIKAQLDKLNALPDDEPLAQVQDLAPHLRANLVLPAKAKRDEPGKMAVKRKQVKSSLPMLYPASAKEPLPDLPPLGIPEKTGKDASRLQRLDTRLDAEPYLPAIRVHRYLS